MFHPDQAFVECPACDADTRYVQHVKANRWACNACGHEFTGPASSVAGNGVGAPMTSRRRTREALGAMLGLLLAVTASAQTPSDPLTLPLADLSGVRYLGAFDFPWSDGAGKQLSFGGRALALSADGKALHISCQFDQTGFATIEIPALGGMARVLSPCRAHPTGIDIAKVHPDPSAYAPTFGGLLDLGNGSFLASGYISYDASGGANKSHFRVTNDGATVAGPWVSTVSPGLIRSQMGWVPQEWRAFFGAPAFQTTGFDSIISRGSYTFGLFTFDPAAVTGDNFPAKTWIACKHTDPGCNTYQDDNAGKTNYQGAELFGTAFIVPGTRTLVSIEREADGPACYGYATTNKALHGTPYPGPGFDAQHVVYCYSLSRIDMSYGKGPKGYPYRIVAKLYDLRVLDEVKRGTKQPWEVRHYDTVTLPGFSAVATLVSAAFDAASGRLYVLQNNDDLSVNGDRTRLDVLGGFPASGAPQPPPPPTVKNCDGTWGAWTRQANSESACNASGQRTFIESRLFTVTTSPDPGGLACPASPESRTSTEACNPPIVMETFSCWVTSVGATYADGDARRTIRCDTNGPTASLPNGTTFTVTVPKK